MKKLPAITADLQPLFDLQLGTIRTWTLMSAVELGIFNQTIAWNTASDVADAIQTHKGNTELLLNALCSLELLEKKQGKFRNTELSDTFLVKGKETCIADFLLFSELWMFPSRSDMISVLKSGPHVPGSADTEGGDAPEMGDEFFAKHTPAMANFARSGIAQQAARSLSELKGFDTFRSMLDLGGAHGLDCIATVQLHPELHGVVYDKPPVVGVTKKIIEEYGMEDRIEVLEGDYITDHIGSGYDLIYAKGTLNFTGPALEDVIVKIFSALKPGGVFVSIHEGLVAEKTKPEKMVLSWLSSALVSMDVSIEKGVVPDAMDKAGFTEIGIKPYDFPFGGVLEMITGRKR